LERPKNDDDLAVVLRYLLTDGDPSNIVGLPLIRLADNRHISLVCCRGSSKIHIMFEKNEFEVFGACDNDAIALHLLDEFVTTILRSRAPTVLNVQVLMPETIVQYLKMDPNPLGLVLETNNVSYDVVVWLSKFWMWMSSWVFKHQLYSLIGDLHLLPSANGLVKTSSPIYTMLGQHPTLTCGLRLLGIRFFHPLFSEKVQGIVSSFSGSRNLNDMSRLLDSIDFDHVSRVQLDQKDARALLNHFSCSRSLDNEQRRKMKRIPIFPLIQAGSRKATTVWGRIPDEVQVRSVVVGVLQILPVVQGTIFVDGSLVDPSFLKTVDPSAQGPLSEHEIISMAVQHFDAQSMEIKVAFVEYMAKYKHNIPPYLVSVLGRTPFVVDTVGKVKSPEKLVDPQSDIAPLFLPNDHRFPCMTDDSGQATLIKHLQQLHVMQKTLTTDIAMERIRFISSAIPENGSHHDMTMRSDLSQKLLEHMYSSKFDCDDLRLDENLKWLPTQEGLLRPADCHDENSHKRELFDQVLSVVTGIRISHSLKVALGWHKPLSFQTLADQLSKVLNLQPDEVYGKIQILIEEFSQRDLSDDDFHRLRNIVANHSWVPVYGGSLADTFHAVFSGASPKVGFYQIGGHPSQKKFLLRMGCSEKYYHIRYFPCIS
jgi:hypothetical protein